MTTTTQMVPTRLGRLHVGQVGSGPPAMLWHSLWVDSRSWGPLVDAFAAHRRVVMIDGPGYGGSSPIHRDFTLDECAEAAGEVLDQLGISEPADWVGNAWGGHVGITLAVSQPHRLRSLVTIAAPLTPVSRRQRWTQTYPLALVYRLRGANRFITKVLFDALLGAKAIAVQPVRASEMMSAFRDFDRESMRRTIRYMHSGWRDLADKSGNAMLVVTLGASLRFDDEVDDSTAVAIYAPHESRRVGPLHGNDRTKRPWRSSAVTGCPDDRLRSPPRGRERGRPVTNFALGNC